MSQSPGAPDSWNPFMGTRLRRNGLGRRDGRLGDRCLGRLGLRDQGDLALGFADVAHVYSSGDLVRMYLQSSNSRSSGPIPRAVNSLRNADSRGYLRPRSYDRIESTDRRDASASCFLFITRM